MAQEIKPGRKQKKDFLDSYRESMFRVRCKRLMLEQFREDISGVRGIDYTRSGIPRGKGHISDLSDVYVKIEKHREELNQAMQQAEHEHNLIKRTLDALNDPRGAYAISLRHISRCSWKEITGELGLSSESRAREIYINALDRLEIPEEYTRKDSKNEGKRIE